MFGIHGSDVFVGLVVVVWPWPVSGGLTGSEAGGWLDDGATDFDGGVNWLSGLAFGNFSCGVPASALFMNVCQILPGRPAPEMLVLDLSMIGWLPSSRPIHTAAETDGV